MSLLEQWCINCICIIITNLALQPQKKNYRRYWLTICCGLVITYLSTYLDVRYCNNKIPHPDWNSWRILMPSAFRLVKVEIFNFLTVCNFGQKNNGYPNYSGVLIGISVKKAASSTIFYDAIGEKSLVYTAKLLRS